MNDKDKKRFSSEFMKTKNGMKEYLNKKAVFSITKGRSYSSSIRFKSLAELEQIEWKMKMKRVENKRTSLEANSIKLKQSIFINRKITSQIKVVKIEMKNTELKNNQIVNKLTSKTKNKALTTLTCGNNPLPNLDVSKNTSLTSLTCKNNQLTNLDVTKNTDLIFLWCDENQLKILDISKNTALKFFYCQNNQLTILDVSKNTNMVELDYSNNPIINFID